MGHSIHVLCHSGCFYSGGLGLDANIPRGCKANHFLVNVGNGLIPWQIVGFLAAGLTYAPSLINTLVYSSDGAKEASAAGFILLSMVMVRICSKLAES